MKIEINHIYSKWASRALQTEDGVERFVAKGSVAIKIFFGAETDLGDHIVLQGIVWFLKDNGKIDLTFPVMDSWDYTQQKQVFFEVLPLSNEKKREIVSQLREIITPQLQAMKFEDIAHGPSEYQQLSFAAKRGIHAGREARMADRKKALDQKKTKYEASKTKQAIAKPAPTRTPFVPRPIEPGKFIDMDEYRKRKTLGNKR